MQESHFDWTKMENRIFQVKTQILKITITTLLVMNMHTPALAADHQTKRIDLFDLGYKKSDLIPDKEFQRNLNQRRFYLEEHQNWGLVALGLMAFAFTNAGNGKNPPIEHLIIGTATTVAYGASAYYGIKAPVWRKKNSGPATGGSSLHRNLAWIHLPGMILTPVLGYMAKKKRNKNEDLTSPEKYHQDVAAVTIAAFAISVLSVSFEF